MIEPGVVAHRRQDAARGVEVLDRERSLSKDVTFLRARKSGRLEQQLARLAGHESRRSVDRVARRKLAIAIAVELHRDDTRGAVLRQLRRQHLARREIDAQIVEQQVLPMQQSLLAAVDEVALEEPSGGTIAQKIEQAVLIEELHGRS